MHFITHCFVSINIKYGKKIIKEFIILLCCVCVAVPVSILTNGFNAKYVIYS